MKIAIIGSRRYENKKKIKDFIFKLNQEHGEDTVIVSGGCKDGADKYAKKYALEFELQYEEYPPFHFPHNLYCVLPETRYGKSYSVSNYFTRNKMVAKASDIVVGFIPKNIISNGTLHTIKEAKKLNKKVKIIN